MKQSYESHNIIKNNLQTTIQFIKTNFYLNFLNVINNCCITNNYIETDKRYYIIYIKPRVLKPCIVVFIGTCEGCNRKNTVLYVIEQSNEIWPIFYIKYCIDCKNELKHVFPCCLQS